MNDVTVNKDYRVHAIENSKDDFNDQVDKDNVYILYIFYFKKYLV